MCRYISLVIGLNVMQEDYNRYCISTFGSLHLRVLDFIVPCFEFRTLSFKWHFVNQHHTSRKTSHIPHPEHSTSRESHIPNISHPELPTFRTSTSQTSRIKNIPHPENLTSWRSHISNIPHPKHHEIPWI